MRNVTKYDFLEKNPSLYSFFCQTVFFSRQKGKEKKEPKKNTVAGALLFLPPPLQKDLKRWGEEERSAFGRAGKKFYLGKGGGEEGHLKGGEIQMPPSPLSASLKTIGKSIVGGWGGESQSIPGESPLKYIEREAAEWQKIHPPPPSIRSPYFPLSSCP